ncbi:hypothetical protein MtrunA17_Chr4g0032671 [Medicago truncatula]|uniref:Transmembrane protein n=1 Tax=Medicago truncatula TaxID=3880 RepID=A0A396IA19_MEDTR|nr:hypothetical protein MtrunA17_Chr4g0032671 [Medicago truncatula]
MGYYVLEKQYGGLGVRWLEKFNLSLFGKWCRRMGRIYVLGIVRRLRMVLIGFMEVACVTIFFKEWVMDSPLCFVGNHGLMDLL